MPSAVAYETLTAPSLPPFRRIVRSMLPALSETVEVAVEIVVDMEIAEVEAAL